MSRVMLDEDEASCGHGFARKQDGRAASGSVPARRGFRTRWAPPYGSRSRMRSGVQFAMAADGGHVLIVFMADAEEASMGLNEEVTSREGILASMEDVALKQFLFLRNLAEPI